MVFDKLIEGGFAVRCDKCHIGLKEVPYLGFMVGRYGTRPLASKTKAILDMAVSDMYANPGAAARYTGMIGFYSEFIPDLSTIIAPFHELKAKATNPDLTVGGNGHVPSCRFLAAFEASRHLLATTTALARPDQSKPFHIHVDAASSCGIGAALMQQSEDDPDVYVPLAFWSRRLRDEEKGYSVRDQECLGLYEALKIWRHMILGHKTILLSDHSSLQWLLSTPHADGSNVAGWALYAQQFDLTIEWIPGSSNVVSDCLSRSATNTEVAKEAGAAEESRTSLIERLEDSAITWCASLQNLLATSGSRSDGSDGVFVQLGLPQRVERVAGVAGVRRSERVAVALLQPSDAGLCVFLERVQGLSEHRFEIPCAAVDQSDVRFPYRAQAARVLLQAHGTSATLLMKSASPFRPRTNRTTTHFYLSIVNREQTCLDLNKGSFHPLDDVTLSSLLVPDDRDFLRLVARRLHPRSSTINTCVPCNHWQGGFAIANRQLSACREHSVLFTEAGTLTVAIACTVALSKAASSPASVPSIVEAPNGPALCETTEHGLHAISLIHARLKANPGLCLSLDLEGMLGGRKGHIDLMQLAVEAVLPEDKPLIFVFNTHINVSFLGSPQLRESLEDPSIPKVVHCSYGDASALYYEYGIFLRGGFDTGVADCILRGKGFNCQRRLDRVIAEYVPGCLFTHKGSIVHIPRMFQHAAGTLPLNLFVYAYEDVLHCCALYRVMRDMLIDKGLLELSNSFSAMRAPPLALSPQSQAWCPPSKLTVVLRDSHQLLCYKSRCDGLHSLPSAAFNLSNLDYRSQAHQVWSQVMGSPGKALRGVFASRMRKSVLLAGVMVMEVVLDDCSWLFADAKSTFDLLSPHASTCDLVLRPCVNFENPAIGSGNSLDVATFQYIHWIASQQAAPQQITSLAEANVVVGKVNGNMRAAIIVHDNTHVFCLTTKQGPLVFPSMPIEIGSQPSAAAIKAFELFAGPALGKHDNNRVGLSTLPVSSRRVRAGLSALKEIATQGNTVYFGCFIPDLADLRSAFYAARRAVNGFRLTATNSSRYPGFTLDSHFTSFPRLDPFDAPALNKLSCRRVHSAFERLLESACAAHTGSPLSNDVANIILAKAFLCEYRAVKHAPAVLTTSSSFGVGAVSQHSGSPSVAQANDITVDENTNSALGDNSSEAVSQHSGSLSLASVIDSAATDSAWFEQNKTEADVESADNTEEDETLMVAAAVVHYSELLAGQMSVCEVCPAAVEEKAGSMGTPSPVTMPTVSELLAEQECHPATGPWVDYLREGELSAAWLSARTAEDRQTLSRLPEQYFLDDDGLLCRRSEGSKFPATAGLICVPPSLRHRILYHYHDRQAHFGTDKVLKMLQRRFHWGSVDIMRDTICKYIKSCQPCQLAKVPTHNAGEQQIGFCGHHPGDVICGDIFYVGFEEDGYDHTLDFADHFTRGIRSDPLKGMPSSEGIVDLMLQGIIRDNGVPSEVRSDAASNFISKAVRFLYQRMGIKIEVGTAHRHQLVALVERWHRTLLTLIRVHRAAITGANWGSKWYRCLPLMELAYNLTVNNSTGFSPFFLKHIRHGRSPVDLQRTHITELPKGMAEWVQERLDDLNVVYDAASESLRVNALTSKRKYDLRRDVSLWFKPGDRVLLIKGSVTDKSAVHVKAVLPMDGPFTIIRALPYDRYLLSDLKTRRIRNSVHVSRLVPYFGRVDCTDSKWRLKNHETGGAWPVQGLVGRRLTKLDKPWRELGLLKGDHVLEYRVRWTGFTRDSDKWRPLQMLGEVMELVNEYDSLHPRPAEFTEQLDRVDRPAAAVPPASEEAINKKHFRSHPHAGVKPPVDTREPIPVVDTEKGDGNLPIKRESDDLQRQLAASLAKHPVGTRVRVHFPRDKMAWVGTVVKSWLPRWRSADKKPAHHILVTYDDPAFEGELFEHNVQESVIDVLSTGPSASRSNEVLPSGQSGTGDSENKVNEQCEVLPSGHSGTGDSENKVKEDELDDKTRKRLLRIQRQLA